MVAGSASCTAVQGGLLVGMSAHCRDQAPRRDLAAVGGFVGGRLASHALVGALLGWLGAAVTLNAPTRAALLVAAGLAVMAFAARLLVTGHVTGPVGTASAPDLGRAVVLGAATVLIPCGVTLTVELVAVSSGSPLGGAAVMAGFVLGTAPAFAALGLVLRRVTRGRAAAVAGVIALLAGAWTVVSGLRLGDWLPEFGSRAAAVTAATAVRPDGTQTITVWATGRGYRPGFVSARAGMPTELVLRTHETSGCARRLTVAGREVTLPATGEVRVSLGVPAPGRLRYVCAMGMYTGFIDFRGAS
ncbi:sulfite exporter TauE/SafE family protein [Bailinhaonella thermotolerans]|uniref:Sulfite exporter TauE/SafE family protein n=1 Tax=Bailinhaonella thermotolerans TaxID=1070861 RepID=A0A3A4ALP7_9ACTN|nr:sulfite exporter TauE/SafE family protein [Bailinhaonella thermotolerans]